MNIIYRINKFMQNRYGIDNLYKCLFNIYIILLLVNIIIKSKIIYILDFIILFIITYRVFSKRINARRKENDIYLKLYNKIDKYVKRKTDKYNIFKKCRKCKKILKLPIPYERGIKKVKCPSCGKSNTYLILKKQKIEIIKNKK